jgi:hypothetical protein
MDEILVPFAEGPVFRAVLVVRVRPREVYCEGPLSYPFVISYQFLIIACRFMYSLHQLSRYTSGVVTITDDLSLLQYILVKVKLVIQINNVLKINWLVRQA